MDERALRRDLLVGFHVLDEEGQGSGIAGHLTARLPAGDGLLGHRYGFAFDEVRPGDILATDFDLNCADGGRVTTSLGFHVAIYRARAEIGAIIHTHPPGAIALGAAGRSFQPVYQSALMLAGDVVSHDRYDGIIETPKVGEAMAAALGPRRALMLRNHGIVVVGRTIREAVCAAVILEENCRHQLRALAVSDRLEGFPAAEAAQAREFLNAPHVIEMRWQQLARKAARIRPFLQPAEAAA